VALDFATYRPPGVYVEEAASTVASTVGTQSTVVALVGPSIGYRTYTEVVTLLGTDPTALTKLGINASSVVVTSLDGSTTYEAINDYITTGNNGPDNNPATQLDNGLTLARIINGTIPGNSAVRVTYRYTDAAYYSAVRVGDFEVVKDLYGEPIDPASGSILSPLSMGAKIALENGARELVLVAVPGTSSANPDDFPAAFAKIANLYEVGVVVPLTDGLTSGSSFNAIASHLRNHCESASADGFYRVGALGIDIGYSGSPTTVAEVAPSSRLIVAWPNRLLYYNTFSNQATEVGGQYLAAAYAGRLISRGVQHSLTRKTISGFAGISASSLSTMTKAAKDGWSSSGVSVTELTRSNALIVRHGTSTDVSSTATREISITRAKDQMVRLIQDSIDAAQIVGSPLTNTSVVQIKAIVGGVLSNCKDSEIIVDYSNLVGRVRPGEPQIIEVKFAYRPAWPLNYILVSFSIDTTTGTTEFDAGTSV